ncbi:MAG TPA: HxlR family transcriptional regulator [Microscillaceae bacterium]|nr:HxlR family transcriptional regulator [Microscillaceae bacterium]
MEEVTKPNVGNPTETVTDNQANNTSKKIQKLFHHLDPTNPPEVCPIRDVLSPVSDKWSVLIMIFLGGHQKLRFNALKKNVYGISSKMLTERLKTLERDGYLKREAFAEVPVRVEYQLTPFGYEYLEKLLDLMQWVDAKMPEVIKNRKGYLESYSK